MHRGSAVGINIDQYAFILRPRPKRVAAKNTMSLVKCVYEKQSYA